MTVSDAREPAASIVSSESYGERAEKRTNKHGSDAREPAASIVSSESYGERAESVTSLRACVQTLGLGRERLHRTRLAELAELIGRQEHLWRPFVRHDSEQRWYARLLHARNVEVWLIGWETGQDTSFHDHGGSSGAFYVADGRLTEEFGSLEGRTGLRHRAHRRGRVVPFGPAYVHNLGNSDAEVATSIHAYSPPLATMTYYRPDDGALVPYETLYTGAPDPGVDLAEADSPDGCFTATV